MVWCGTEVTGLKQDEPFMRHYTFFTERVPALSWPADAPIGLAVGRFVPGASESGLTMNTNNLGGGL